MASSKISPNVALATVVGCGTSAFLWWDGPVCYPSQKRCKCNLHLQLTPTTQTDGTSRSSVCCSRVAGNRGGRKSTLSEV